MEDARKNRTKWEDAIQELVLGFQYEQGQLGGTVRQQKKKAKAADESLGPISTEADLKTKTVCST